MSRRRNRNRRVENYRKNSDRVVEHPNVPAPELNDSQIKSMASQMRAALAGSFGGAQVTNHREEALHYEGNSYVNIAAICAQMMMVTITAYVDGSNQLRQQSVRKSLRGLVGSRWKSQYGVDEASSKQLESDHYLMRLLSKPNPHEPGSMFRYRQTLQLRLTGGAFLWNVPNINGRTCERYVIPTTCLTPVYPDNTLPYGGYRVQPNCMRWIPLVDDGFVIGTPALMRVLGMIIDAREIQKVGYPHPIWLDDFQSPMSAGAQWVDAERSINIARAMGISRGMNPSGFLELSKEYMGIEQDALNITQRKLDRQYGGVNNTGKVIAVAPDTKFTGYDRSPKDMEYHEGYLDHREANQSLHGVHPIITGGQPPGAYAAYYAAMRAFDNNTLTPICDMLAESDTFHIAPQFGEGITIEIEPKPINDEDELNSRLQVDGQLGIIKVNEARALRGMPPLDGAQGEKLCGPTSKDKVGQDQDSDNPSKPKKPKQSGDAPSTPEVQEAEQADVPKAPENPIVGKSESKSLQAAMEGMKEADEDYIQEIVAKALDSRLKAMQPAEKPKRKYSSTQFDLPAGLAEKVQEMAALINPADLASDGIEENPHVTCLYGLTEESPNDVKKAVKGISAGPIVLESLSLFPAGDKLAQHGGEQFDVLKISIGGKFIHEIHNAIAESCEYETDYADYSPHCTIAYLKPGKGRKYVTMNNPVDGMTFIPDKLIFSSKNRTVSAIRLSVLKSVEEQPSEAQITAGNYKKDHITIQGLRISIENPKGSVRSGRDDDGNEWSTKMRNDYGYIKGTKSDSDGDHIDVFVGPNPSSELVFVIDQVNPQSGQHDEHKCMLGFDSKDQAKSAYLENYSKGWKGFGGITPMHMDQFKEWLDSGDSSKGIARKSLTAAFSESEMKGHNPISDIQAIGKRLAESDCGMPGYGQIFIKENGSGQAWYVGGDGDERGFDKTVIQELKKVTGIDEVRYESESFPPDGEGWIQVYPKVSKRKSLGMSEGIGSDGGFAVASEDERCPKCPKCGSRETHHARTDGTGNAICSNCKSIFTDPDYGKQKSVSFPSSEVVPGNNGHQFPKNTLILGGDQVLMPPESELKSKWITIHPGGDKDATGIHILIDEDGEIKGGPAELRDKGIRKMSDFGKEDLKPVKPKDNHEKAAFNASKRADQASADAKESGDLFDHIAAKEAHMHAAAHHSKGGNEDQASYHRKAAQQHGSAATPTAPASNGQLSDEKIIQAMKPSVDRSGMVEAEELRSMPEFAGMSKEKFDQRMMDMAKVDQPGGPKVSLHRYDRAESLSADDKKKMIFDPDAPARFEDGQKGAYYNAVSIRKSLSEMKSHWITIHPHGDEHDGTHVLIDGEGNIEGGPEGLAKRGIHKLSDFGKGGESADKPHETREEWAKRHSDAADHWLHGVNNDLAAVHQEHGDLITKKHMTDSFRNHVNTGRMTPDQYEDHVSKGTILGGHDYERAQHVEQKIHEIKNRPLTVPEPDGKHPYVEPPAKPPEEKPEIRPDIDAPISKKDTPRETAAKQKKIDDDYAFARNSSIPNVGEDVADSARHKRNAWRGLEDAESNGTAESMVTRDNLLKAEPHNLMSHAGKHPLTSLAMHYAMRSFPAKPSSNREVANASDRKDYHEAYQSIKAKAEHLAETESDPRAAAEKLREHVGNHLKGLRERKIPGPTIPVADRYNKTANNLVGMHKALRFASYGRPSANSVHGKMEEFSKAMAGKYGLPEKYEPEAAKQFASHIETHAKDIIDGKSLPQSFGIKGEKKNEFNPADRYVKHAERAGGKDVSHQTATGVSAANSVVNDFGMRGVQWGNSVTDDERHHHAAKVVEALTDLADTLGIKPADLSLGGKLALAIGARGKGTASAHYEPHTQAINLTRASGVGTLAHEWGHAFDHSLENFANRATSAVYHSENYRSSPAMQKLTSDFRSSGFTNRIHSEVRDMVRQGLMSKKKAEYWLSTREQFARCFESYVQHKLADTNQKNTYLAGLISDGGLWPTKEETAKMAPAFDSLFAEFRKQKYGSENRIDQSRSEIKSAVLDLVGQSVFKSSRWITIHPHGEDAKGVHIQINDDGEILSGPAHLRDKGITHMGDFAKRGSNQAAVDELKPHALEFLTEQHKLREHHKAEARKLTGKNAGNLAMSENSYHDHSDAHRFETAARTFARENPDAGLNPDAHDTPAKVWELIREGKKKAPLINSKEVHETARAWVKNHRTKRAPVGTYEHDSDWNF